MRSSRIDRAFARFLAKGDPRDLARVFDATAPELFRLAWHLCGDQHAAEDLVQGTFLAALEDTRSFDPSRSVLPWLCGILAHRASTSRRRIRGRSSAETSAAIGGALDPADAAAGLELTGTVHDELRALPDPYREVLILHLEHGLSGKEIADVLHRPAATVRSQIMRGLELLRQALPMSLRRGIASVAPLVALEPIRAIVLAEAGAVAAPLLGPVTGLVVMKKLVAVVVVLVLGLVAARQWLLEADPKPSTVAATEAVDATQTIEPEAGLSPPTARVERESVATPLDPTTGAIEVTVRWAEDGSPARDMGVSWTPQVDDAALRERLGRTDAEGVFMFSGLAPGPCEIGSDRDTSVMAEVRAGATERVTIDVPTGIAIHGLVVGVDKQPIGGAQIWLSSGRFSLDRGGIVGVSAADGTFGVRAAQPSRWVSAWAEGYSAAVVQCVPGLNAGAELSGADPKSEIILKLQPVTGTLRGRVVQGNGDPIDNAVILVGRTGGRLIMHMARPGRSLRSDASGSFGPVSVVARVDHLWARAPGFAPWHERVEVAAQGTTSVEISLLRGAAVTGTITDERGEPAEGVWVRMLHDDLEPLAGQMKPAPDWVRVETMTDTAGHFVLACLMPGRMKLKAERESLFVTADFDLIDEEQQVWNTQLAPGDALRGSVVSAEGEPLNGWSVRATPAKGQKGLPMPRDVRTDARGRFEVMGAERGLYDLVVFPGEAGNYSIGSVLRGVQPGPELFTITVPLDRVPSVRFEGRILTHDGQPPIDYRLSLYRMGDDGTREGGAGTERIEEGRFTSKLMFPGRYFLSVEVEGHGMLQLGEWEARAFETVDTGEHRFLEPGGLNVELVDAHGERIRSGRIVLRGPNAGQGYLMKMEDGLAELEDLQPGRYLVSSWGSRLTSISRHVDVVAGQVTEMRFEVPDGVLVNLLVPPIARDNTLLRDVWRDENGDVVFEATGTWDRNLEPMRWKRTIPPGRYSVEFGDASGPLETIEVIASEATRDVVVELPPLGR